jgi:hypothetical protein
MVVDSSGNLPSGLGSWRRIRSVGCSIRSRSNASRGLPCSSWRSSPSTTSNWSWRWFAVLLFAPDLAMIGYLAGARIGGTSYNLTHTLVGPVVLLAWWLSGGPQASVTRWFRRLREGILEEDADRLEAVAEG